MDLLDFLIGLTLINAMPHFVLGVWSQVVAPNVKPTRVVRRLAKRACSAHSVLGTRKTSRTVF